MPSGNPFRATTYINDPEAIIDVAFRKAVKIQVKGGSEPYDIRAERREKRRIASAGDYITNHLFNIVRSFPNMDDLHPFYMRITDVVVGLDELRRNLGRIQGLVYTVQDIQRDMLRKFAKGGKAEQSAKLRSAAFGRFGTVLRKTKSAFQFLIEARKSLTVIPGFDPEMPTIVVAGAPNVGKSSLVIGLSTGTPEIGAYPFTTKQVTFGHRKFGFLGSQIVDTPGLLDRPLSDRNEIELQSIIALREIADVVLLLFDVSELRTLDTESQLSLASEIKEFLGDVELIPVTNKVDVIDEAADAIIRSSYPTVRPISALTGEGLDQLISELDSTLKSKTIRKDKFTSYSKPVIDPDYVPPKFRPKEPRSFSDVAERRRNS